MKIEIPFQYDNEDGTTYVIWFNGVVISILNEKSNYFKVRWNIKNIWADITKEKLLVSKLNPNKAWKGTWREYFGSD